MGAKQLAIVLAPNILYCNNEGGDPNKIVALHSSCNQVVFKLLSSYHSSLILVRLFLLFFINKLKKFIYYLLSLSYFIYFI